MSTVLAILNRCARRGSERLGVDTHTAAVELVAVLVDEGDDLRSGSEHMDTITQVGQHWHA